MRFDGSKRCSGSIFSSLIHELRTLESWRNVFVEPLGQQYIVQHLFSSAMRPRALPEVVVPLELFLSSYLISEAAGDISVAQDFPSLYS